MAPKRDPKRDEAFEIYKQHNGNIQNRTLANEIGTNEKTIGSWKSKDKWNERIGVLQSNSSEYSNRRKGKGKGKDNKEKTRGEKRKRSGNPNPKNQFAERNKGGYKHGLFSKYLPPEMNAMLDEIEDSTILEQLWLQIKIMFANMLRAQEIIWVNDRDDHTEGLESTAFAHEKHETLIKAHTRAMAEYRNLVKKYMELAGEDDERVLKLSIMQKDLEIKTAQADALTKENEGNETTVIINDPWRVE